MQCQPYSALLQACLQHDILVRLGTAVVPSSSPLHKHCFATAMLYRFSTRPLHRAPPLNPPLTMPVTYCAVLLLPTSTATSTYFGVMK